MEWVIYGGAGLIILGVIIYSIFNKDNNDDEHKKPPSRWD